MNEVTLIEMGQYLKEFEIPDIPEDTSFWLVRTMSGYFYEEFIAEGYVALGWNYITQNTSFDDKNIKILKDDIKERYGDKRPGVAVNKCMRFIKDAKPGDYVLIPNPDKPEKLFLFSTPCVILKKKGVFICYSLINTLIKFMASLPVMTA